MRMQRQQIKEKANCEQPEFKVRSSRAAEFRVQSSTAVDFTAAVVHVTASNGRAAATHREALIALQRRYHIKEAARS